MVRGVSPPSGTRGRAPCSAVLSVRAALCAHPANKCTVAATHASPHAARICPPRPRPHVHSRAIANGMLPPLRQRRGGGRCGSRVGPSSSWGGSALPDAGGQAGRARAGGRTRRRGQGERPTLADGIVYGGAKKGAGVCASQVESTSLSAQQANRTLRRSPMLRLIPMLSPEPVLSPYSQWPSAPEPSPPGRAPAIRPTSCAGCAGGAREEWRRPAGAWHDDGG